jgi:integrase
MFRTKAEAIAFETRARGELAAGVHVADSSTVTVAEAGALWVQSCQLRGLEASTLRQYRQHLDLHINPLLGSVKLSRLTQATIEAFCDELLRTRSQPLARAILVSLKSLLKVARKRQLIGHNPAQDASILVEGRHRPRVTIPTRDELRLLINEAGRRWSAAEPWRTLLIVAVFSGLRSSELTALSWGAIDLDAGILEVRQRVDRFGAVGSPKSRSGRRSVPLATMAINALRTWKSLCPASPLNLVFPSAAGGILSNKSIHTIFWDKLQRLLHLVDDQGGLKFRLHDLRHASASLFIAAGMNAKRVSAVMGHANIQTTFDIYAHLFDDPEGDRQALAKIEDRLMATQMQHTSRK